MSNGISAAPPIYHVCRPSCPEFRYSQELCSRCFCHIIECACYSFFNCIDCCSVVTRQNQHHQQTGNQYAKLESDTAHISEYLVSISYNKRINQQQCNDKRNKTRGKEIALTLPAHHLYNVVPVCSHLIQNSILRMLVNRIRCEMQSQNGHADDCRAGLAFWPRRKIRAARPI